MMPKAGGGSGGASVFPTGLLEAPDAGVGGMGAIPPTPLPTPMPSAMGSVAGGAGAGAGGKKQASVVFAFPPFLGGAAAASSERQLRREREREKKEKDRERRRQREKQRAAARKAAATGVGLGGVTTAMVLPTAASGVGMELETTTHGALDGGEEGELQKCVACSVRCVMCGFDSMGI
jgi:hypothetical protein